MERLSKLVCENLMSGLWERLWERVIMEKKKKLFLKKFVVVKEMFLSLQPRFFEKIFWKLKKGKKWRANKDFILCFCSRFLTKNSFII